MRRLILGSILDIAGILVIVISFLLPFHFFLPAWNHTGKTFEVEPYKTIYIDYDFFMGGNIRCVVQVSGQQNNTIDFSIEDSSGKILTSKRIENIYTLEFSPQNTGLHKFSFDNTINPAESKSINLTVKQYYYNILFLCLGFALFICGIALIIIARE